MKRLLQVTTVIFLLIIACGTIFLFIRFKPDTLWGENIDTSVLPEFRASLKAAKKVVIFEGLPHQFWESDALKSEASSNETITIHGFHFYVEKLVPSTKDTESLINALIQKGGIIKWQGQKKCGGYHPDYVIQWRDSDDNLYQALICFGCHEIKLYGDRTQLYADLGEDTFNSLKSTLSRYGDKRPDRP